MLDLHKSRVTRGTKMSANADLITVETYVQGHALDVNTKKVEFYAVYPFLRNVLEKHGGVGRQLSHLLNEFGVKTTKGNRKRFVM